MARHLRDQLNVSWTARNLCLCRSPDPVSATFKALRTKSPIQTRSVLMTPQSLTIFQKRAIVKESNSRINIGAKVTLLAIVEWAKEHFTRGMQQRTIDKYFKWRCRDIESLQCNLYFPSKTHMYVVLQYHVSTKSFHVNCRALTVIENTNDTLLTRQTFVGQSRSQWIFKQATFTFSN